MELNDKRLDEWFSEIKDFSEFPNGENYTTRYKEYSEQLNKWVHTNVNTLNAIKDKSLLTDHGAYHIKTLIDRATKFLDGNDFCKLSVFEVYILLMAIHVHDVGNILGRTGHESNSKKIIALLGNGVVDQDDLIWEYIYDIAKAHKGEQIQTLPLEEYLHDLKIRPQFLAAIVKFADELAENSQRANLIGLKLGEVPPENLLYHVYAKCINSIVPIPKEREIKMIYHLTAEDLSKTYDREGKQVYLLDYIYERTLKTYSEKVYCMKFMRPFISFDNIRVNLHIKLTSGVKIVNGYELAEKGIENINMEEIMKFCPELKHWTGAAIFDKLQRNELR